MNLSALDLNLLVAFDALVTEKHVSRAAQRIGLSQPAMSHALSKLRYILRDEILVRGPRGLQPTPKALELAEPIGGALQTIRSALDRSRTAFAPESRKTFIIAMSDYSALLLLPKIMQEVRAKSPHTDLIVRHANVSEARHLVETGQVELAIGNFEADVPGVKMSELRTERFVCIASADHPAFNPSLSFTEYMRYPHVLISIRDEASGTVDAALSALRQERRIALVVPYYTVAGSVLRGTDLILTVSEGAARFMDLDGLIVSPAPIDVQPIPLSQLYTSRFEDDEEHLWLRGIVANAVTDREHSSH